jgi:hypothetical protein
MTMGFMNDAWGDQGAPKIREEDGMSTATSRVLSADDPGEIGGSRALAIVRIGKEC